MPPTPPTPLPAPETLEGAGILASISPGVDLGLSHSSAGSPSGTSRGFFSLDGEPGVAGRQISSFFDADQHRATSPSLE